MKCDFSFRLVDYSNEFHSLSTTSFLVIVCTNSISTTFHELALFSKEELCKRSKDEWFKLVLTFVSNRKSVRLNSNTAIFSSNSYTLNKAFES